MAPAIPGTNEFSGYLRERPPSTKARSSSAGTSVRTLWTTFGWSVPMPGGIGGIAMNIPRAISWWTEFIYPRWASLGAIAGSPAIEERARSPNTSRVDLAMNGRSQARVA